MHVFMGMACLGQESIFQCYYTPKELRDFYDQERATLYRLEPERRSARPLNWRKGSPTNTTTTATPAIQSSLAVTEKPGLNFLIRHIRYTHNFHQFWLGLEMPSIEESNLDGPAWAPSSDPSWIAFLDGHSVDLHVYQLNCILKII